jgi:hypothetical protein
MMANVSGMGSARKCEGGEEDTNRDGRNHAKSDERLPVNHGIEREALDKTPGVRKT